MADVIRFQQLLKMKRSSATSPSVASGVDEFFSESEMKPDITAKSDPSSDSDNYNPTSSPAKKKATISPGKATEPRAKKGEKTASPKKEKADGCDANGEWSPEKRELFMDRVIAAGYKVLDLDELAGEVSHSWICGIARFCVYY